MANVRHENFQDGGNWLIFDFIILVRVEVAPDLVQEERCVLMVFGCGGDAEGVEVF